MNKLKQNVGKEKQDVQEKGLQVSLRKKLYPNRIKSITALNIVLALTVFFGSRLSDLRFNYSFNSFFPKGDDDLEYYEQFIEEFGQHNDFLFVVLKTEYSIQPSFIEKVNQLKNVLESLPETQKVTSPFDLKGVQINPLGVNTFNLISRSQPTDQSKLEDLKLLGQLFGREDESAMLILRHQEFLDKKLADSYYLAILQSIKDSGFEDAIASGKIQMQYDFTQKLETELGTLLITSLIVVLVVLLALFRSLKGLILPITTLVLTIIWTMGFMAWTGKPIDVMVVMIPAILLIIALSDVIHFVHKYDELRNKGLEYKEAIHKTILTIGKATFLTSVTTAIGFISLVFIPIGPIREFGLITAAGVIMAFLITFLVLPALLYFFPSTVERRLKSRFNWELILGTVHDRIIKKKSLLVICVSLVSIVLIAGIPKLHLSTSLIVGLQKNEPELQKVAYFDKNFDGYKPFELGIELNADVNLLSPEVIAKMAKLENYLIEDYGVAHLQSPLNIIREINAGRNGGSRKYIELPKADDLKGVARYYNSPRLEDQRQQIQANDGKLIRMIGRNKDLGSAHYLNLNTKLEQFLTSEINGDGFEARITGASYLIDKTDEYVVSALLKGIGFALLSVSFFILIFFKSLRLAIYTLVPNLIPIAILFGLMGWFGVHLNISTAIIFTVALGIAIDDSIHFIARYKLERDFHTNKEAIKNAFTGTGKSILVTSIVIVLGFSVFLSSGFSASYYLGFFIVLAAVIALLLDLIILPIILSKRKG
ncbi:efflux RND transporter permease subunit [Roseivirga spongicola]|uniref:efflux RND transporter permease subunit n=1 Tax=Roseivirga spongicola TaxID=333140 RepID=UPI00160D4FCB|nr:MMPL family transporter [Roseivirga spongicola]